jgi:hypothetical protein
MKLSEITDSQRIEFLNKNVYSRFSITKEWHKKYNYYLSYFSFDGRNKSIFSVSGNSIRETIDEYIKVFFKEITLKEEFFSRNNELDFTRIDFLEKIFIKNDDRLYITFNNKPLTPITLGVVYSGQDFEIYCDNFVLGLDKMEIEFLKRGIILI